MCDIPATKKLQIRKRKSKRENNLMRFNQFREFDMRRKDCK